MFGSWLRTVQKNVSQGKPAILILQISSIHRLVSPKRTSLTANASNRIAASSQPALRSTQEKFSRFDSVESRKKCVDVAVTAGCATSCSLLRGVGICLQARNGSEARLVSRGCGE